MVLDGNKELVRVLFEHVFNDRDLDLCDDIFATDYVEHAIAPFGRDEPGAVVGPVHIRNVVTWLGDQHPDITMKIESMVAEGKR